MTSVDYAALSETANTLATGAGDLVRRHALHARSLIDTKSSTVDMVTDADHAAEAFLVENIQALRPDDGILGEEGTRIDSSSGITWVIDPIDGTTNFVYSIPSYAVSVGAVLDGHPIVGAVYNPVLDELYSAYEGGGAFLNGSRKLHVNAIDDLSMALVATGFNYSADERHRQGGIVQTLLPNIRDIRRAGAAALDLCNVASGRVDAYFERGLNPWDITAGTVIAREAGARVTAFESAAPSTDIIAAPPAIFDQLKPYVG